MEVSQHTRCGLCETPSTLVHRDGVFHVETPCKRCGSYLIAQLQPMPKAPIDWTAGMAKYRARPTIGVIEAEDLQRWFDR